MHENITFRHKNAAFRQDRQELGFIINNNERGKNVLDKMDLFSLLFISFPEAILVTALGFLMAGLRPCWRDLLLIGAIQAFFSYLVRQSPVPFGLHSILEILLFTLNILMVTRLPYRIVMLVSLLGLIFYGSIETVVAPFMLYITGYSMTDVLNRTFLRVFFFLPQALIMLIFITTCKVLNISLITYSHEYNCPGEYLSKKEFQKILKANIINKQNLFLFTIILMPMLLLVILNITYNASKFNSISEANLKIFTGLFGIFIAVLAVLSAVAVKKIGQYVFGK